MYNFQREMTESYDSYDFLFKFLVIGAAGTGKSCLLHQFIEGQFKDESSHTIGVEFGSKVGQILFFLIFFNSAMV